MKFLFAVIFATIIFGISHNQETETPDTDTVDQTPFKEDSSTTEVISSDSYQEINEEWLKGGKDYDFETDINHLLGIIINSLYTNKDIFLRELISNASDALDKIRYQSLLDQSVLDSNENMMVYIRAFPNERKIVIRDDGHGMTKENLIKELGTIARSGTKYFIEQFTKAKEADLNLIGQFGVGFYSAFLVAERVVVVSKHNDDPNQHIWSSTADGKFSIVEDPRGPTLGRGTEVILYLKEGMDKYLDSTLLKVLIEKYSEFVPYPINVWTTYEKEVSEEEYEEVIESKLGEDIQECDNEDCEVDEDYDEDYDDEDYDEDYDDEEYDEEYEDEDVEVEEGEEEKPKKKKKRKVQYYDWNVVNQNQPLWTRSPKEIYREEYQIFYKANVRRNGMWNPLSWTHFAVEGNIEFSSILFIPKKHPERWMPQNVTDGITLYVKRVMIQEDVPGFLPGYLHFISGVVDSNDLPLHISRELLQKNKLIHVIKRKLEQKIFALINKLAREERTKRTKEKNDKMAGMLDRPLEEPDEEKYPYTKFWEDWGVNIRAGIIQEENSRKELIPLLRYYSTKSEDELTSFEDYVSRMPEDQRYIYYLGCENFDKCRTSIFVEELKRKDYEVLYFTDAIDSYMINHVKNFAGFKLVSVTSSNMKIDKKDKSSKKKWKIIKKEFKPFLKHVKSLLGSDVEEVKLSERLHESVAVVTAPKHGLDAEQIKLLKQQALAHGQSELDKMMMRQRVLEINPYHPVVIKLKGIFEKNKRNKIARKMIVLMFDTALIRSGYDLSENAEMADRISDIMEAALKDVKEDVSEDEFDIEEDIEDDEDFDVIDEDFTEEMTKEESAGDL